jgi:hypothetical protein
VNRLQRVSENDDRFVDSRRDCASDYGGSRSDFDAGGFLIVGEAIESGLAEERNRQSC